MPLAKQRPHPTVEWNTDPLPIQAHAFLGTKKVNHIFKFNPHDVSWGYKENVVSRDTLGGRVDQFLSAQVESMTVNGSSGARPYLQEMAANVKKIMEYQIDTLNPVNFKVPSRRWDFLVYVEAMPQIGWDVSTTSYPYMLTLRVEKDLTGVKTREISMKAIDRLAKGIGFDTSVHGGDPGAFQKLIARADIQPPADPSQGVGVI